jgi:hypothetical protein
MAEGEGSNTGMMLGAAGISAAGSLISAYMQGKISKEQFLAQLAEQQRQFNTTTQQDAYQFDEKNRQANADQALASANTTPNRVGWRQNQAMAAAIMPGLRNVSVSSNIPGMSRFIPQISGGLRIPEGGFGPDVLSKFGDKAMLAGEMDLDKAAAVASDGQSVTPDYGAVYGEPGRTGASQVSALSGQLQTDEKARAAERNRALQSALAPAQPTEEEKKGTPWWRKALGGAAAIGLTLATGGAGAAAAPGIYRSIAGGGR